MEKNVRTFYLILFLCTFFIQIQPGLSSTLNSDGDHSQSPKKIAVAAVGDSITSEISSVAGRAPYYLIFDEKGVLLKTLKNPAQFQRGGASSRVVALLKNESVTIIIAGRFGNKMINQLKTDKIEYNEHKGIVKNIVESILKK